MSLYTSFNIAQQALLMNQSAMNVVSSNISNMNTTGYSKQRLNSESSGYMEIVGANKIFQVSAGAQIGDISRYRDQYLDNSYRDQNSNLNFYNELYSMASIIENSMNELSGSGLQDAISQFFTAASTLQTSPADSTARVNFAQKAQVLCTQFNQVGQTLTNNRTATVGNTTDPQSIYDSKLYGNITDVNNKLQQLGNINDIIVKSSLNNSVPSDLLDQRDKLLDEISQYMPITVTQNANSSVNLHMNGIPLVNGVEVNKLDVVGGTAANPTIVQLRNKDGDLVLADINNKFVRGKIASYIEMGGVETGKLTYQNMLTQVDQLANQMATALNAIQKYDNGLGVKAMGIAFDANNKPILSDFSTLPDTGLPDLFSDKSGLAAPITAMNISVDPGIVNNYWKIATARVDTSVVGWDNKAVGNGDNVQQMSKVRNLSMAGLSNMNPETFLTNTVSNMGSQIESIEFNQKAQASLFSSANLQRQSAIGVNLDEELVDLVKYQRAYEASARIFTVASDIMQQMVNLGR